MSSISTDPCARKAMCVCPDARCSHRYKTTHSANSDYAVAMNIGTIPEKYRKYNEDQFMANYYALDKCRNGMKCRSVRPCWRQHYGVKITQDACNYGGNCTKQESCTYIHPDYCCKGSACPDQKITPTNNPCRLQHPKVIFPAYYQYEPGHYQGPCRDGADCRNQNPYVAGFCRAKHPTIRPDWY